MFTWASVVLYVAKLLNTLASMFQSKRERDAGATTAELKGRKIVQEIADEQDKRAASPLSDDAVANRLRKRTG